MLSSAGLVVRRLEQAAGFEITFWRSFTCLLFLAVVLTVRYRRSQSGAHGTAGWPVIVSGGFWAVMFTCFSIALTLTTVAKALVLISISPLLAALLARLVLGEQIAPRTWLAIAIAAVGCVLMVSDGLLSADAMPLSHWGMLIAAAVPLASAGNLILLKKCQGRIDFLPAVLIGAAIPSLAMLPLIFPVTATISDIAWLAGLGVFQLGVPCSLIVIAARYLAPQEVAMILLLEVVCGPIWVWLGVGEQPAPATLWGGALVITALIGNELGRGTRQSS